MRKILFKRAEKWYNIRQNKSAAVLRRRERAMCEILAPAGNEEAFFAALNAGADAVYLGLADFSARRGAENFTAAQLERCAAAAHAVGARVHVALNTLVKDGELASFFARAREAWNAGADALIIQDVFLGRMLREAYPELVLHLSTQAGVCNAQGARFARECGFSRVILARETPLQDIEEISHITETEAFVQGALCTCFSGQCYMSSFIGGNSGNRGLCKQPCRKRYSIDRAGFENPAYRLSLSDLSMGEGALRLRDAGVSSFKIEGRMRSAAYVAAAVQYYKHIFAGEGDPASDLSDLKRTYNRGGFTSGYAFGQDKNLLSSDIQGHAGERIGTLSRPQKNEKFTFVDSPHIPSDGDGFKIIRGGKEEVGGAVWHSSFPRDGGGFYLPSSHAWREGDGVYITMDTRLGERLLAARRTVPVLVEGTVRVGEPPRVRLSSGDAAVELSADFIAQPAKNRPFSEEEFTACFQKTDGYPFDVRFGNIRIQGECFLVKSALNALRRAAFERLYGALSAPRHSSLPARAVPSPAPGFVRKEGRIAVIDSDFSSPCYRKNKIDIAVFKPHNYRNSADYRSFSDISEYYAWHKYLYLPAYCTGEDIAGLPDLSSFDGIYAEGSFGIELCRERGLRLFAGTGFNLFDRPSALAAGTYAEEIALSKELSLAEAEAVGIPSAFVLCGGGIKVMELGHCPFGMRCRDCDKRSRYTLTDESGRAFPLLRYTNSACRFEVYNCSPLAGGRAANRLYDLSSLCEEEKGIVLRGGALPGATSGAFRRGTL